MTTKELITKLKELDPEGKLPLFVHSDGRAFRPKTHMLERSIYYARLIHGSELDRDVECIWLYE